MARLLQINVRFCGRSREFIKACFHLKTNRFFPLCVFENKSKCLLLLIICKHTYLPTASRLCSEGTSLNFHRLNSNAAGIDIYLCHVPTQAQ